MTSVSACFLTSPIYGRRPTGFYLCDVGTGPRILIVRLNEKFNILCHSYLFIPAYYSSVEKNYACPGISGSSISYNFPQHCKALRMVHEPLTLPAFFVLIPSSKTISGTARSHDLFSNTYLNPLSVHMLPSD